MMSSVNRLKGKVLPRRNRDAGGRCDVMVNVMCDRGNGQGGVVLRGRCVCSILIGIIHQHFC